MKRRPGGGCLVSSGRQVCACRAVSSQLRGCSQVLLLFNDSFFFPFLLYCLQCPRLFQKLLFWQPPRGLVRCPECLEESSFVEGCWWNFCCQERADRERSVVQAGQKECWGSWEQQRGKVFELVPFHWNVPLVFYF